MNLRDRVRSAAARITETRSGRDVTLREILDDLKSSESDREKVIDAMEALIAEGFFTHRTFGTNDTDYWYRPMPRN